MAFYMASPSPYPGLPSHNPPYTFPSAREQRRPAWEAEGKGPSQSLVFQLESGEGCSWLLWLGLKVHIPLGRLA